MTELQMVDILCRLRAMQQLAEADKPFSYVKDIFRCAADEIERLRAERAGDQQRLFHYEAAMAKMSAEQEKK